MDSSFDPSRRRFLRTSTLAVAGAAALSGAPFVVTAHAAPDDPIRVGVIGCGGRGTGAMLNVLGAGTKVIYPQSGYHTEDVDPATRATVQNVEIVALADLFPDRLARCREQLTRIGIGVPDEACFTGFEAYRSVLAHPDVNYVILATPPHFRPEHFRAAVEAGKHVFMEKPLAVDGPGVRTVLEAAEVARQKGLGVTCGVQRRHDQSYVETIRRLQDGAIGDIHTARVYWNGGGIWAVERRPEWSDAEWQLRNWNYFTWLSGDHIVEQHVHNLDVARWVLGKNPTVAYALGGRQTRTPELHGHIYDHFAVEFEYADGTRVFSQCRQMDGISSRVEEAVTGTLGTSDCHSVIRPRQGAAWRFQGKAPNPYEQEHIDLINSIRRGAPINTAREVAESTLMGIMGRESAYSGEPVTWEQALNAKERLGPAHYAFGPLPFPEVPMPGKHRLA